MKREALSFEESFEKNSNWNNGYQKASTPAANVTRQLMGALGKQVTRKVEEHEAAQSATVLQSIFGGGGQMFTGIAPGQGLLAPVGHQASGSGLNLLGGTASPRGSYLDLLPLIQQAAVAAPIVGGNAHGAHPHEKEALAARHSLQRMQEAAGGLAATPGQPQQQPQQPLPLPTPFL